MTNTPGTFIFSRLSKAMVVVVVATLIMFNVLLHLVIVRYTAPDNSDLLLAIDKLNKKHIMCKIGMNKFFKTAKKMGCINDELQQRTNLVDRLYVECTEMHKMCLESRWECCGVKDD